MSSSFMLYGATGFVGDAVARMAVQDGLRPILAGRNTDTVGAIATELGLEHRVFGLDDAQSMDSALGDVTVVLHCAGPYINTYKPMVEACLRTRTHYLDLTGEIPVFAAIAVCDAQAKAQNVMLLPGVGFDVVPTDCLAAHLQRRLPTATHLTIAFHLQGPAGFPPGSLNTLVEMLPFGIQVRRNGQLKTVSKRKTRMIDFGQGPVEATLLTWGDISMAYHSTGIPNIEDYAVLSRELQLQIKITDFLQPIFRLDTVRNFAKRGMKGGSTAEERSKSSISVWGEAKDDQGQVMVSRLHGPEGGVIWTGLAALAVVRRILNEDVKPGFQTPATAYGPDFVLECEDVTREDLDG